MNHLMKISIMYLITMCMVYGKKSTILVVLGCADNTIQQERVNAAIEFINNSDAPVKLYVSGGVKNAMLSNEMTEASRMASNFKDKDVEIILDEKATNTAENFAYLKKWVRNNFSNDDDDDDMPNFVITTSDYHKNRAETIFNGILPEVSPVWNLSVSNCKNCWTDEHIHMRNVKADIYNAVRIIE